MRWMLSSTAAAHAAVLIICVARTVGWSYQSTNVPIADSVRIRAVPTEAEKRWRSGGISDPAGLRGVEYQWETKKPYEWMLKFNLANYKDEWVKEAYLEVTKCAASANCKRYCTEGGTCSCQSDTVKKTDCGGGNIDEAYKADSDDLHVWHVSNGWDNSWKHSQWAQTFDGTTRSGVEQCCDRGSGGADKLQFATYISGTEQVGEKGRASLSVAPALGAPSSVQAEGSVPLWVIEGGFVSFRLTVNGTNARFFVPESGDFNDLPNLKLVLAHTTTTTTTWNNASSELDAWTSTTTTFTAQLTTSSTTAGGSETSPPTSTLEATSAATTPTAAALTTTTSSLADTKALTQRISNLTNASASMFTLIHQKVLKVYLHEAADTSSIVSSTSFRGVCREAVAMGLQLAKEQIKIVQVNASNIGAARRLQTTATATIQLFFTVDVSSLSQMDESISMLHGPAFLQLFKQGLQKLAQAMPEPGSLKISRMFFISSSSKPENLSGVKKAASKGGELNLYGTIEWPLERVQTWSTQVQPAVHSVVLKRLLVAKPSMNHSDVWTHTEHIVIATSSVQIQIQLWASMRQPDVRSDNSSGTVFQEEVNTLDAAVLSLLTDPGFAKELEAEIVRLGFPLLPGMSLSPGASSPPDTYNGSAASAMTIGAALVVFLMGLGCFCFAVKWRRDGNFRRRCRRKCLCGRKHQSVEPQDKLAVNTDVESSPVSPFRDEDGDTSTGLPMNLEDESQGMEPSADSNPLRRQATFLRAAMGGSQHFGIDDAQSPTSRGATKSMPVTGNGEQSPSSRGAAKSTPVSRNGMQSTLLPTMAYSTAVGSQLGQEGFSGKLDASLGKTDTTKSAYSASIESVGSRLARNQTEPVQLSSPDRTITRNQTEPVHLSAPDKTPMSLTRSQSSPMRDARIWSPSAQSNSTNDSEEMVIDVTDSESDAE